MAAPLPWFPFYIGDYQGDELVRRLTFEERGIFIELLCHQWREDSIPANPREVARMIGMGRPTAALRRVLERLFITNGKGDRLVNARMAEEFVKQAGRSQKATERWRRWMLRRRQHGNGGPTV